MVACITAFNALPLPVSTPFARDLAILTTKGADLGSGVATREERDVIFLAPKLMEREREKKKRISPKDFMPTGRWTHIFIPIMGFSLIVDVLRAPPPCDLNRGREIWRERA